MPLRTRTRYRRRDACVRVVQRRVRAEQAAQRFCTSACRKRAHRQRQREASAGVVVELPTTEALLELSVARAAAGEQWGAAAWLLERKWPERWSVSRGSSGDVLEADVDDPFLEVDQFAAQAHTHLTVP